MRHSLKHLSRAAVILLLLFFSCAPKQASLKFIDHQLVDPRIVHGTLDNGFKYLLVHNTTPADRVEVHLDVFAGSMHETDSQQGLAHYLEHMLFNGSEHFKPGELVEYFQKIGMDFGADANAHTSFFNTVYDLSLPKGGHKDIYDALTVILDYAKGALLLPEEIDRERGIILAEKRERDSVSYRTFQKSLGFELAGSDFPSRFPIGIDSVLNTAQQLELKTYYDAWYRPDNMALIMVGQFDLDDAKAMIKQRFSALEPRLKNRLNRLPVTKWTPHTGTKGFYHYEPEAGSTDITIETLAWKPFENETVETIKKHALAGIANQVVKNRLSKMIRSQEAEFSEASIYSGHYLKHLQLTGISATCRPEKWKATIHQLENTVRQAIDHGFSDIEINRVKQSFITGLESAVKQESTRKSSQIAKQILTGINNKKILMSAVQKKDILVPYISGLAASEVRSAFQNAWAQTHRLILVTGNVNIDSKTPESDIVSQYRQAADKKVALYQESEAEDFPYLNIPARFHKISNEQQNINDLGITAVSWENNLSLYVKKTDFKKNQINFKVNFGEGQFSIPRQMPGLSILSEKVIQDSGLGRLDQDQLNDALSGKDISFNFSINDTDFSFSGTADPKDIELVFQLIYHFMHDPGFRLQALELSKDLYRQEYTQLLRTTDGIMKIMGTRFFNGEDPRFGLPDPKIISRYSLDDIKNWILPYFKDGPIQVSIVGDINTQSIIKTAGKYLGAFKPRPGFKENLFSTGEIVFPSGMKKDFKIDTKIESGLVRLALLTDDFWDIRQTRRLSILSRIISEKLRVVIREELGEAYSPYAYNDSSQAFENFGLLHVSVAVKPENHQIVYSKLKEIIDTLQEEGVTQQEVDLVLKPVVNHIKVIRATNTYWINSVMGNSARFPQRLEWAPNMLSDYQSISSLDINRLIKKYIRMDNSAVIFVAPENQQ